MCVSVSMCASVCVRAKYAHRHLIGGAQASDAPDGEPEQVLPGQGHLGVYVCMCVCQCIGRSAHFIVNGAYACPESMSQ